MKKKILAVLCAGLLAMAPSAAVFAAEAQTAAEDEAKNIGKDAEGAFHVMLTNMTGKDVKAVQISNTTDYSKANNLLTDEDIFKADEERMLCYLPVKEEKIKEEAAKEGEKVVLVYNIQFTFADDTTAEIHTFPFGDVEASELHLEGEVAYLVFESVSQKKEINTQESETKIAEEIKAVKEAAEAAANSSSGESYDYYEDYSDYDYSNAGSGDGGNGGGGDACLGGGIIF